MKKTTFNRVILSVLCLAVNGAILAFDYDPNGMMTADLYKSADAVFLGKVKAIKYLEKNEPRVEPKVVVEFKVLRSWKGNGESMTLHTVMNKFSGHGAIWRRGEKYLIFAQKKEDGMFDVWLPSVISKETEVQRRVKELGNLAAQPTAAPDASRR